MQTNRIPRPLAFAASLLLVACAGSQPREPVEAPQAQLSIPEHALDALPMEYLLAAEFALREENLDAAAEAFLNAALVSEDVGIARRATRVNLAAQRWQDADRALRRWRELGGGEGNEILQTEAVLALGQGDADRAVAYLLALLTQGGMPATRLAGSALEAAPDRGLALLTLERIAESPDLADDSSVLIGLSQLALQLERNDIAHALAERATERLPEASEVWFWRARLANAEGDPELARRVLAQAVELSPDDPDVRRTYAVLLKNELGDVEAAARALADLPPDDDTLALRAAYAIEAEDYRQVAEVQRALETMPLPHPSGRLLLIGGLAEARADQVLEIGEAGEEQARRLRERAATWYEQVGEDDEQEYERALQRLAVLDQQAGRIDQAIERLAAVREVADPGSDAFADSFLLESELLEREDRRDEALAALNLGLAALPDDERLRYSRGLLHERMDQVSAALEDFRTLHETDPDNPVYLNAYGYTLADRTERFEEALVLIERALSIQPDDVATVDSMGWVLYRLGRNDEALDYLHRAYEAQPDAEIGAHLGEVLWVTGEHDQARAIWRAVQDSDPDHSVLKATLERFKPW